MVMTTKIKILCENTVYSSGLVAEHGFSMAIKTPDEKILFDTGQGYALVNNMKVLGEEPESFDCMVLSHGHYDHTGGLMDFLCLRKKGISILSHEDIFVRKVKYEDVDGTKKEIDIGIPFSKQDYEKNGGAFEFFSGYLKRGPLHLINEIEHDPEGKGGSNLMAEVDGKMVHDPFRDDLSMLIETESGPVVILGCAHAGAVEILDALSAKTGYNEFFAVIGGTHLHNASRDYYRKTVDSLKKYRVGIVAAAHCTGFRVAADLSGEFREKYVNCSVGTVFEF